jgi:hypothetical protein
MKKLWARLAAPVALAAWLGVAQGKTAETIVYRGMCDASAVVALGPDEFVAGDDEDNNLRVYSRSRGGMPLRTIDVSSFLGIRSRKGEADLEDATKVGDRIYWISSHGRNKKGKEDPSRFRFFATSLVQTEDGLDLKPIGKPYRDLLQDLIDDPRLERFNLSAAAQLAPKEPGALNIEGLCATADGRLLIGFRNPLPEGKALIVPLENPAELVEGKRARFGDPLLVELGGLGIAAINASGGRYLIAARSYDGRGASSLYEWNGRDTRTRRIDCPPLAGLNAEGMEFFNEGSVERLFVVSDDGTVKVGRKECKRLKDPYMKQFRAVVIEL